MGSRRTRRPPHFGDRLVDGTRLDEPVVNTGVERADIAVAASHRFRDGIVGSDVGDRFKTPDPGRGRDARADNRSASPFRFTEGVAENQV